ncbi:MAG: T9SS type A sorting domain-containing protein [Saprospiraceae bacterium]
MIDFSIFPNPTTGELKVDLTQYAGLPVRIEVYNLQGHLLQFAELDEVQTAVESIDLSDNTDGMYLIRVKSAGMSDVMKRVVLAR